MKKISEGVYVHRGYDIIKDNQGIWISGFLVLFQSLNDAKEYINQHLDGTNKHDPRIIGTWSENFY